MSNNKGKSPFELGQYSTGVSAAGDERKQLFNETEPHTDTDAYTEELKTKRMYLLVRPSVAEKITKAAKAQKTSANDLIHQLMEQYIQENNL